VEVLLQNWQLLSEIANGQTTKSPGRSVVTAVPTCSIIPMNSCPIRTGTGCGSIEW